MHMDQNLDGRWVHHHGLNHEIFFLTTNITKVFLCLLSIKLSVPDHSFVFLLVLKFHERYYFMFLPNTITLTFLC